jgi:diadenosine tetraphosphate (Ap4A) HIT family hydrolase
VSGGKKKKRSKIETRRRIFVGFSHWFSGVYLFFYVIVPFCRAVLPPDLWGEIHLVAARSAIGTIYNHSFAVPWFKEAMTAIFPVTLLILSLHYGGLLTEFYAKIRQFGIHDVREDRHGQDAARTPEWIDRISRSKEVEIIGTISKGWFVNAFEELDQFLQEHDSALKSFKIYLLDPFAETWRARVQNGFETYRDFWRGVWQILDSLKKILRYKSVELYFYDSEPLSCVISRGFIYLGLYLPRTERKEAPELTISVSSYLGDKIYNQSIRKLKLRSPPITPVALGQYSTIMSKHINSSADEFWDDPSVHCDFCKESAKLPTNFSRLFPDFGDRVVRATEHFRLVPTISQITPEHALLVSTRHVTASAQLERQALEEIQNFGDKWAKKLGKVPKTALVFEHGLPFESTSYGGCGICHCHVHVLSTSISPEALPGELEAFLRTKGYKPKRSEIENWMEIAKFKQDPYIAVRIGRTHPAVVFIFEQDQRVESQLMRQFAALGSAQDQRDRWDWRAPKTEEELAEEAQNLHGAMKRLREMVT